MRIFLSILGLFLIVPFFAHAGNPFVVSDGSGGMCAENWIESSSEVSHFSYTKGRALAQCITYTQYRLNQHNIHPVYAIHAISVGSRPVPLVPPWGY